MNFFFKPGPRDWDARFATLAQWLFSHRAGLLILFTLVTLLLGLSATHLRVEAGFNKTSKYWTSRFPGELPETPVVPEVLNTDEILVDSQVVNMIHVGQGDIEGSTIFHVPSADAVVCGDVVYNNVHMMMYEADEAKREAWIASIDAVAALNAKTVVAGHMSVGAADLPENLAASQRYLRDFTTLANKGGTVEDLVNGMLELHGERDQPHTLWISARAEVARRA